MDRQPIRPSLRYSQHIRVVTDPTGAVVPNATVKVTNVDTRVVTTLKTNSEGVYNASSLNPGVYDLQTGLSGFKTAIATGIKLDVGASPKVNLTLQVGGGTHLPALG